MVTGANFGQNFFSSGQFPGRGRGPGRGQGPGGRGGPPGQGAGPPGLSRAGLMQGLGGGREAQQGKRGRGGRSGGSGSSGSSPQGIRQGIQPAGQQQPVAQPGQAGALGGIATPGLQITRTSPQQYLEALRGLMTPSQLIAQTVPQAGGGNVGILPNVAPANPQGLPGGFTSIPQNPFAAIDTRIGSGLGTINNILQLGGIQVPI